MYLWLGSSFCLYLCKEGSLYFGVLRVVVYKNQQTILTARYCILSESQLNSSANPYILQHYYYFNMCIELVMYISGYLI